MPQRSASTDDNSRLLYARISAADPGRSECLWHRDNPEPVGLQLVLSPSDFSEVYTYLLPAFVHSGEPQCVRAVTPRSLRSIIARCADLGLLSRP